MTDQTSIAAPAPQNDPLHIILGRWKEISGGAVLAGAVAFGIATLIPPTFTAKTVILPPQQQQSSASAALASLGALAGLAGGGGGGLKNPTDQYVALLQSNRVSDQIIKQHDLAKVYETELQTDTRKQLAENVRIYAGKKDGLISIEVDDESPERSADIANSYVKVFQDLNASLAISEAQQRRAFFEQQLEYSKERLTKAQQALQSSGFNASALKVEPQAEAGNFARIRAELSTAELRLQSLRQSLSENAPEIATMKAQIAHLQRELQNASTDTRSADSTDYVSRFREFKYQETLFQMMAQQYELARVDESREGALIQVVDVATPPERKSKPKRGQAALLSAALAAIALMSFYVLAPRLRQQESA